MKPKTKSALLWLQKFAVAVVIVLLVSGAIDWLVDGTPFHVFNTGGILHAAAVILILCGLDAWEKRHG